ncbi:hypothetical protein SVIOM74S_01868 [Streptomyces violarus]
MRQFGSSGRPGGRVGHGGVGVRFLQSGPVPEGPGDDHGAAHDLFLGDRAAVVGVLVGAGVRGVVPVVAHHPQPARGNGDVERRVGRGVAGVQVVLDQRDAVDGHASLRVAALDAVSAHADDPLDEVLLVVGRQQADEGEPFLDLLDDDGVVLRKGGLLVLEPAAGVLEHDDVPALRLGAEPRGELVDQDAVADLDRLLHGAGRDDEGLDEEGLQHERYEDGDADEEGYLLDGTAPAAPLDLLLELAPLGARTAAGGAGGAPGAGGQQVVRGAGGDAAAVCRGYPWAPALPGAEAGTRA